MSACVCSSVCSVCAGPGLPADEGAAWKAASVAALDRAYDANKQFSEVYSQAFTLASLGNVGGTMDAVQKALDLATTVQREAKLAVRLAPRESHADTVARADALLDGQLVSQFLANRGEELERIAEAAANLQRASAALQSAKAALLSFQGVYREAVRASKQGRAYATAAAVTAALDQAEVLQAQAQEARRLAVLAKDPDIARRAEAIITDDEVASFLSNMGHDLITRAVARQHGQPGLPGLKTPRTWCLCKSA